MNLIVIGILLLKLSTSLICSKSKVKIKCRPDMEAVKLGTTMCGSNSLATNYSWSHTSWKEGKRCLSGCKSKMIEKGWEEACCQAGTNDKEQVTYCLVRDKVEVTKPGYNWLQKAVKCKVETSTTGITSTSTLTTSTTTTSKKFTSGPQSANSIWSNSSLDVTATKGDLSVYKGDKMTLSCTTNHNWKTCGWLYDGKMCRYEYAYDKENPGNEWSYKEISCDPKFAKHELKKPESYYLGNKNKKCTIQFKSAAYEGKYLCKFQRCNPEEEDGFCKTTAPADIPMFNASITVKIQENKPELEKPDKASESSACKLNGNKERFLMLHATIAQLFLMLHVMKHKKI